MGRRDCAADFSALAVREHRRPWDISYRTERREFTVYLILDFDSFITFNVRRKTFKYEISDRRKPVGFRVLLVTNCSAFLLIFGHIVRIRLTFYDHAVFFVLRVFFFRYFFRKHFFAQEKCSLRSGKKSYAVDSYYSTRFSIFSLVSLRVIKKTNPKL